MPQETKMRENLDAQELWEHVRWCGFASFYPYWEEIDHNEEDDTIRVKMSQELTGLTHPVTINTQRVLTAFWHCVRHEPTFARVKVSDLDIDAEMGNVLMQHAVLGESVFD